MYALVVCNPGATPEQRNYYGYRVLSKTFSPQTPALRIKGQAPPTKMFLKKIITCLAESPTCPVLLSLLSSLFKRTNKCMESYSVIPQELEVLA